ncbi:DJ-1/PfpI family protein [Halobaculum magnesiiphilum]|uniref:DJ-1/PfpI family protein n=1 Tax=Halobaculum magnesiiphilum TaxID=1017351 RepID=A0A8T8WE23_9EURY|nr:DJ-1/PfpI family protein [Halobaculum magnesiiphilum]QZP38085.1 DJ-1/PfpI family protein [Halobaculum magnesiiphilum]
MDIAVLLYEGFDELDAVGPFEVFRNAEAAGADFHTELVSLDGPGTVTASHGMRVEAEGDLPEPGDLDLLVVPGGGWNDRSEAGAWAEYERGAIPEVVAAHHDAGATVASVCTGGMLLSKAGVFDGRPAVTHASALEDLRDTDADVREERVVDDGDVLSAGGVTSGIDLALHIVEREAGAEIAESVATTMEYTRQHDAYEPGAIARSE